MDRDQRSPFAGAANYGRETVEAIKVVALSRFTPDDPKYKHHVFITRRKRPFLNKEAVSQTFRKLKIEAGIGGTNRGFYVLRHVCRDVANQQSDDTASRWIMGHKRLRIDDEYTRTAPKDRIENVCNHVRSWFVEGLR